MQRSSSPATTLDRKTILRTGLGKGLFSEMRYKDDGSLNPDFVLNKPAYKNAKIIVAGDNFRSETDSAPRSRQGAFFRDALQGCRLAQSRFCAEQARLQKCKDHRRRRQL